MRLHGLLGHPPGVRSSGGDLRDLDCPENSTENNIMNHTPIERFHGYMAGVLDGSVVAGSQVKSACERTKALMADPDIYLDEDELTRLVPFMEQFVINDGHDTHGQNVTLMGWQVWVLGCVTALKWKEDDAPVLKENYQEVARGAGKSAMAALLAIYWAHTCPGIDVNVLSGKQDQAAIILGSVKDFLESTGEHGLEWDSTKYEVTIGRSSIKANHHNNQHQQMMLQQTLIQQQCS